jgi:hypothetical protein
VVSSVHNLATKKSLPLLDGGFIVLIDMLGHTKYESWDDSNRNVYRLDAAGNVVWRIGTMSALDEKFPYTNIYFNETGALKAYCWSGGEYAVDFETGNIDHGKLSK